MRVREESKTRACADDIGSSLSSIRQVKPVSRTFQDIERATGLELNFSKCHCIPLCPPSRNINSVVQWWFKCCFSSWSEISVSSSGTYLGFEVGPEARSKLWRGVMQKAKSRTCALAASGALLKCLLDLFGKRCLSVASYVSQLADPPHNFEAFMEFGAERPVKCDPNLDHVHARKMVEGYQSHANGR